MAFVIEFWQVVDSDGPAFIIEGFALDRGSGRSVRISIDAIGCVVLLVAIQVDYEGDPFGSVDWIALVVFPFLDDLVGRGSYQLVDDRSVFVD